MDKIIDLKEMYEKKKRDLKSQENGNERLKEYRRKLYHRNKDKCICVTCGKRKALKNKTRCSECRKLHKKHTKKSEEKSRKRDEESE